MGSLATGGGLGRVQALGAGAGGGHVLPPDQGLPGSWLEGLTASSVPVLLIILSKLPPGLCPHPD